MGKMKRLLVLSAICFCMAWTPLAGGAEIKDAESATHDVDSSSHRIVATYPFPGFKVVQ